jgi:cytochrome P450
MPVDAAAATAIKRLPPRGSRLPLLLQTFLYGKFRHHVLPRVHRRHGDVFTLKLAQFGRTVVVVTKPADLWAVFTGPDSVFHGGEGNAVLEPAMGAHSLLVLDEADHKRMRRLVMPAFTAAALRGYQDLIAGIARDEVANWPIGRPFASYRRMQELTLEVILRVVFGVTDPVRLTEMRPLLRGIAAIGPMILLGLSDPRLRRIGPWRRFRARQDRLDELLYAEIAERRQAENLAERTDILSRLLQSSGPDSGGLSDAELRDQLITLLLAGHETTAAALAWALHELARRPGHRARAARAASEGDDEYLTAVAKEVLRIRPVVYEVARRLAQPVEIGGYHLPPGVAVLPAIGVSLADPQYFPDAEEFRPERFLDGTLPASAWLPFGGGARRCVGAGFALLETAVVVREVLRGHELAPDRSANEPAHVRSVTLVPARGARIVATRRESTVD